MFASPTLQMYCLGCMGHNLGIRIFTRVKQKDREWTLHVSDVLRVYEKMDKTQPIVD